MLASQLVSQLNSLNKFLASNEYLMNFITEVSKHKDLIPSHSLDILESAENVVINPVRSYKRSLSNIISDIKKQDNLLIYESTFEIQKFLGEVFEFSVDVNLQEFRDSLNLFKNSYRNFLQKETYDSLINLIFSTSTLENNIKSLYDIETVINNNLLKTIELNELFEEKISLIIEVDYSYKKFANITQLIQDIYSLICNFYDVNESEYQLKIEKIETGTPAIFSFFGNIFLIRALNTVLKTLAEFYRTNFTQLGRVQSGISKNMEAINTLVNSLKELESSDIKSKQTEEEMKILAGKLLSQTESLVAEQTRIIINGESIPLVVSSEDRILEGNSVTMLESSNDDETN